MNYKFINTEYLDSVSDGDPGIVKELVGMFKEQIIEFNNEMRSLYDKKDYPSLGALAHKAKSSVAIMGMNDLALMLKNFELQAKAGKDADRYEYYITRFSDETKKAVEELDDLVENL